MKKKLLTMMLISMAAALAIPMGASAIYLEDGSYQGDSDGPQIMLAEALPDQTRALGAYGRLIDTYGEPQAGSFPENYGGAYIDGETLVILLTDMAAEGQYREICGEYADSVTFSQAACSYNALNREMQEKLYPLNSLAGCGIDEKENCIFIEAVRSIYPDPDAFAASLDSLLTVPYRIEWVDNYAVTADGETEDAESWTDPETGYTYEDGVNVTVQDDIMLLSDDGDEPEAAPIASVPQTGVPAAGLPLAGVAAAGLTLLKKLKNR